MKRLAVAFMLIVVTSPMGFSWPQQLRDGPKQAQGQRRLNILPRRQTEDVVVAFYVDQFQRMAQVSEDVFVKVLPHLRGFIQDRFEISNRRRRALNQLRMEINSGGAEEDVQRWIREIDGTNDEIQANQQRFMGSVDPLLNTQQQGRIRLFLDMSDQRIRQILSGIQNPPASRQNTPAPQN